MTTRAWFGVYTTLEDASRRGGEQGWRWPLADRTLPAGLTSVACLAAVLFWLLHEAFTDDAYITLVYARNLAYHFHWGLLPGQISNTATSPLNVLLLGAVTFVVRAPVPALGIVYVAQAVALAFGLARLGESTGIGSRLAWVCAPLLLLNPLLASSLGLETGLAVTLLVFLAWAAVRANGRWFGVVAGLVVLTRLDLVVFVGLLFLARPHMWRAIHRVVGWAGTVALPWFAFSWVVLGSAVSDTLLIKTNQTWGSFTWGLIGRYELFPWSVATSMVVPALGLVCIATWPLWRRVAGARHTETIAALALGGLAYFAVYALLDVPPYFWYYGPTVAALTLCGGAALSLLPRLGASRRGPAVLAAAGILLAGPAVVGLAVTAREGIPFTRMPMHVNWARPGQYTEIGRELERIVGDAPVSSPGEIGTLLFSCDCHLVDRFSDRGRLTELISRAERSSPLMRLNYFFLNEDALVADPVDFKLKKRPGLDPSPRDWNIYNPGQGWEHIELERLPRS